MSRFQWDDINYILGINNYRGCDTITSNSLISDAICMTCRPTEGDRLCKIFDHYFGCHPKIRLFPVRNGLSGPKNINKNWIEIISDAIQRELPYVTVFESDAYPCKDVSIRLRDCLVHMPSDAYAVLWGCSKVCYHYEHGVNDELFERSQGVINGAYSVTVFQKSYKMLLDCIEKHFDMGIDHIISSLLPNVYFVPKELFCVFNDHVQTIHRYHGYSSLAGYSQNNPPEGFDDIYNIMNDTSTHMYTSYPMRNNPGGGRGVYDLLSRGHGSFVKQMLDMTRLQDMVVLEVGAYTGAVTSVMCNHNCVRKVFAVDYWEKVPRLHYGLDDYDYVEAEKMFDIVAENYKDKVVKHKGSIKSFFEKFGNVRIDVVYLDGYHDFKEVLEQIRVAKQHGVPIICGHDYPWNGHVAYAVGLELNGPSVVLRDSSWIKYTQYHEISIESFINNAFCISQSDEEYRVFAGIFNRAGFTKVPRQIDTRLITFSPEFMKFPSRNNMGCTIAHRQCVAIAKSLGWDHVTVFETDAYPSRDCVKELSEILSGGVPKCAGMVVWGTLNFVYDSSPFVYYGSDKLGLHNGASGLWGSQAVTYFKSYYDTYLQITADPTDSPRHSDEYKQFPNVWISKSSMFMQMRNGIPQHWNHMRRKDECYMRFDMPPTRPIETMRGTDVDINGLRQLIAYTGLHNINMIEIGSYRGESANVFAQCNEVSAIQCIDPWGQASCAGYVGEDMSEVESQFDVVMNNSHGKIKKYKGTVHEFLANLPDVTPDLWYIDGDHDYEFVKYDILAAMGTCPRYIGGHDYHDINKDVMRAVDEVLGSPDKVFCDSSWIKRMR